MAPKWSLVSKNLCILLDGLVCGVVGYFSLVLLLLRKKQYDVQFLGLG